MKMLGAARRECRRGMAMASQQIGDSPMNIFDRALKRKQRDRAAALRTDGDSLLESVTETLLDRLQDCKKQFPVALNLGGCLDHVQRLLKGRGGVEKLIMMDMSQEMLNKVAEKSSPGVESIHIIGDEEFLPIKPGSLDLIVSCLGLHWVNDVPGAMTQCKLALKPDGFFLASIFGGETLRELRISCTLAQLEREGGISPRVSPLSRVSDAGNLLTRAGFAIPAVDTQDYVMKYPSAMDLIDHVRCMGEMNCLLQRNPILKRDTALAAAAIYESMFREEDGTIPATFQVIYMGGWSPDPSQQKPARRGSGTVSFADIEKALGNTTCIGCDPRCLRTLPNMRFSHYYTVNGSNRCSFGSIKICYTAHAHAHAHTHTVENGHIKKVKDEESNLNTLEIIGLDVKKNSITCPSDPKLSLGIKHHYLIMIVKNLGNYFGFEVLILDSHNEMRYLRVSNFEANSRVSQKMCSMPVKLAPGWNQLEFNLADFTRRAYGTKYVEALRVQVHANCRIRRIYFSHQLYPDNELPDEFKLVKQKRKSIVVKANEPQYGDILRARPEQW